MVVVVVACVAGLLAGQAEAKPLKVYILAGQSNMQGQAKVETFDYIGDDAATAPLLKEMRGPDGKPRVCRNVWISYLTGGGDRMGEGVGKLTAGYGARKDPKEDGGKIGPEFTFGITVGKAYDGPVLLIKTAWGGKSLNTDFRPPSAGPYEFNATQLENFKKQGKDIEKIKAEKAGRTGHYYRLMIQQIAGFVWFQGWNDMVDGSTYPERGKVGGGYPMYSKWMADFIRDVRKDLCAAKMPFVIGVMGVGGPTAEYTSPRYKQVHQNFRDAMAAPAKMPEFKGNVAAVLTELYWDKALQAIAEKQGKVGQMSRALRSKAKGQPNEDGKMTSQQQREYMKEYRAKLISPKEEEMWKKGVSNAAYHYLGCAKIMAQIGKAFAEAMLEMERK